MSNKQCTTCKQLKPISEFGKNNNLKKYPDGYINKCFVCKREYERGWYSKDPIYKGRKKENQSKIRLRNRRYILDYFINSTGCMMCGERNPVVLEFHHTNETEKNNNVSNLMSVSLNVLKAEIDKCVILCSNCHTLETAIKYRWYDAIMTDEEYKKYIGLVL